MQAQEAQRVPKKLDPMKHTPKHIIISLAKTKNKERILEAAREKDTITYKGLPIRLSADFSKETLQATRLSLIHISEPTRQYATSRMPSSA